MDQERVYTFNFSEEEMGTIMFCLGEQPARIGLDLINRLNQEGAEQKEKLQSDE